MKRMVTMLALVAAAGLLTTAPAQAAAKDPVQALKSQFAAGKGVKFTETTKFSIGEFSKAEDFARRTGRFQFGPSGVLASDVTSRFAREMTNMPMDLPEGAAGLNKPERVVRIKKTSYISGGFIGEFVPPGKTWFKMADGPLLGVTGMYGQLVNITEPKTLKAMLAKAKRSSGAYSGTITFAELRKLSPWFRASLPGKGSTEDVVTWKLQVNSAQVPQRLTTSYPGGALGHNLSGSAYTVETRFTGWGTKVTIKAPPAGQVTTKLTTDDGKIPTIPLKAAH